MAMVIWDLPEYKDILYILPFSFADTRHAIILMHNCVAFRMMISEEAAFKFAQNHYNDNYDPKITDNDLRELSKLFKKTCGCSSNIDVLFTAKTSFQQYTLTKIKGFWFSRKTIILKVVKEQQIAESQFFDIT